MARRSRGAPEPDDYLPEEDDELEEEDDRSSRRKKRRRPRDDDDDEEPRSRRRRGRDDDDDDEDEDDEEPRTRRRRSRDDDEEPRKKRRRPRDDDEDEDDDEDDDEEDEPRPRRKKSTSKRRPRPRDDDDEDEDEEDEPPRSRSKKGKKGGSNRASGWGGYDSVKSRTSGYAEVLRVNKLDKPELIKFVDDGPFQTYGLHWFDDLERKKGWVCLESIERGECPSCDEGDKPKLQALFDVLVADDDGDWVLKVLEAGTRLGGQLRALANEGKGGLSKNYWSISAGPKGSGTANLQRVKERDLEDDWDMDPVEDDELEEHQENGHTLEDVQQVPSRKELKGIMQDLRD